MTDEERRKYRYLRILYGAIEEIMSAGNAKYVEVPGNTTKVIPRGNYTLLVISRQSMSVKAIYGVDYWNGITLITGTAPSNVTITAADGNITIANTNSSARNFLVITV